MNLFTLRMPLDELVLDKDYQMRVLENIRYCKRIIGKSFQVVFWNRNLSEKKIKEFISESDGLLFEVNTRITKQSEYCWFLINPTEKDKSRRRYEWKGDILEGIVQFMEIAKHVKLKEGF